SCRRPADEDAQGARLLRQAPRLRTMAVVPRWEWRTFGDAFGDAEARLAASSETSVQDSDELYLLSATSDASVKLRDGLMDVKERLAIAPDGLEQWKPVLKKRLPLPPDDAEMLYDALKIRGGRADL